MAEKKIRSRGFNQFRKLVRDKPSTAKYVANCQSCKFLNANDECTNNNVTQYDIVEEEGKTFCAFWKGFEYDNGRRKKDFDW